MKAETISRIYTLTLSPAYDVHAAAQSVAACHENLATVTSREAGGKGVNISRALRGYGVPNTAVVVLGSENSEDFKRDLEKAGLTCTLLEQPGRIRENLTIHAAAQPETRISFTGFSVDEKLLETVKNAMQIDGNTVVTFTGRVPEGITMDAVKVFLHQLQEQGAKIVLDSRSFDARDIFDVRPWLIKPNQEEIAMFFGCPVETMEQALEQAGRFAAEGVVNTMVSLGGQGALLITDGQVYLAKPPKVQVRSTIGAGDSSIAGFVAAAMENRNGADRLRWAVAFGTSACLREGTLPPQKEDIDRILEQVTVTQLQ